MTILIHAVSAKSGGAETYLRSVVGRLARRGKEHRFLLQVPSRLAKAFEGRWDNVSVLPTDIGYRSAWRRFLWDQVTLRRVSRQENASVLLASSDFGMLYPPCPELLLIRNSLFFSPLYLEKILPRKSLLFKLTFLFRRWLILLSIRHASRIMTASHTMLNQVRRFVQIPESRAAVNPFGRPSVLSSGRRDPVRPGTPLRLLYVSEYGDYKNLTVLLRGLPLLKDHGVNDLLLTTTANPAQFPDTEILSRALDRSLASDSPLRSHVRFVGPVAPDEMAALYREADLFLFPSLSESFGHPLVEAMASALPIVASDIPICREICAEAALYFNPFDPKDLADKIVLLRNDPGLQTELGERGRKRAETHFDWDGHVHRLLRTLEELAQQGGGR